MRVHANGRAQNRGGRRAAEGGGQRERRGSQHGPAPKGMEFSACDFLEDLTAKAEPSSRRLLHICARMLPPCHAQLRNSPELKCCNNGCTGVRRKAPTQGTA